MGSRTYIKKLTAKPKNVKHNIFDGLPIRRRMNKALFYFYAIDNEKNFFSAN